MTWKRFLRSFFAVLVAGAAQRYGENPVYLAIAPLLMTVAKWLRVKYPSLSWLPF